MTSSNKLSSFAKGTMITVGALLSSVSAKSQNAVAELFKGTNPNTIKFRVKADNNVTLGGATIPSIAINGVTYTGLFDNPYSYTIDNIPIVPDSVYDILSDPVAIGGGSDVFGARLSTDVNNRIKYGNPANASETTDYGGGSPEIVNENQILSLTQTSPGVFTVVVTNVGDSTDAANHITENNAAAFCQARAQDGYVSNATLVSWTPSGLNNGLGTGTYTFTLPGGKVTDRLLIDAVNRPLTAITSIGTPLPITIEKFTATEHNGGVDLYFKVNQTNVDYYELERSQDGINFELVSTIDATEMNGSAEYNGRDQNPYSGKNYYRLKNIDIDGQSSLSNVIAIDTREKIELTVYPNPASNEIRLNGFEGEAYYMVQDMTGAILRQGIVSEQQPIDISNLPNGNFAISLKPNDKKYLSTTTRFVKQ